MIYQAPANSYDIHCPRWRSSGCHALRTWRAFSLTGTILSPMLLKLIMLTYLKFVRRPAGHLLLLMFASAKSIKLFLLQIYVYIHTLGLYPYKTYLYLSEDVKINPTIWLFFSISASLQKSLNSLLFSDFAPRIKEK